MRRCVLSLLLIGCLVTGCRNAGSEAVTIYAAASAREAIDHLAKDFTDETGVVVKAEYRASSELARQIEEGAPADLFLSADEPWMDELEKRELIEQRCDLLANRLVVIVPADSRVEIKSLRDLTQPEVRRIALGAPEVPVGRYARQALTTAGLWDQVKDRVLSGGDVSATLRYVTRGEADAGIVYSTDAAGGAKVRPVLDISPEMHSPIRYPLAVVRRQPVKPGASRFRDYLASDKARAVFERAGFTFLQ
jgi:molybdate transport system substrate-binding protein